MNQDDQDEWDDAIAERAAADREEALAEGWLLVAHAREAIDLCSEVARKLADWKDENPAAAKMIPFQEVERLAREWNE